MGSSSNNKKKNSTANKASNGNNSKKKNNAATNSKSKNDATSRNNNTISKTKKGVITKVQKYGGKQTGVIFVQFTPKKKKTSNVQPQVIQFRIQDSTNLMFVYGKKKNDPSNVAKFTDLVQGKSVAVTFQGKKKNTTGNAANGKKNKKKSNNPANNKNKAKLAESVKILPSKSNKKKA